MATGKSEGVNPSTEVPSFHVSSWYVYVTITVIDKEVMNLRGAQKELEQGDRAVEMMKLQYLCEILKI